MSHTPISDYADDDFESHIDSKMHSNAPTGRVSSVMNEDDYDYALVLCADDEYRKAAKLLGNITDFQDADEYIENLLEQMCARGDDEDDNESDACSNASLSPSKGDLIADTDFSIALSPSPSAEAPTVPPSASSVSAGKSPFYKRMFRGWGAASSEQVEAGTMSRAHSGVMSTTGGPAAASSVSGSSTNIGEISSPSGAALSAGNALAYVSPFASPIRGIASPALFTPDAAQQADASSRVTVSADQTASDATASSDANTSVEDVPLTASAAIQIISKRQLLSRIGILANKKKWVEKAARRSSMGFESKYAVTDKAVMDAFSIAMNAGIHVRRHQSGKSSEIVRLNSNDGCRSVSWGKLIPAEFAYQRLKEGIVVKKNDRYARMAAEAHSQASARGSGGPGGGCWGLLDCCGLDDDEDDDNKNSSVHRNTHMHSKQNYGNSSAKAGGGANDPAAPPPGSFFYNFGYRYTGGFNDADIIAVHPAIKEDPTSLGSNGTAELRMSNDIYNSALTFSVVLRTVIRSTSGYITLDIECEAEETYCLLVQGFNLLCAEASIREAKHILDNKGLTAAAVREAGEAIYDTSVGVWQWAYRHGKNLVRPAPLADPVGVLFEPMSTGGLLQKVGIGGVLDSSSGDSASQMQASSTQHQSARRVSNGSTASAASGDNSAAADSVVSNEMKLGEAAKEKERYGANTSYYTSPVNKFLPPAQFLGWRSAGTQIWARLKMAGLDVKVAFSWDLRQVLLKVRCPQWRLEDVAEYMHMKLRNCDGTVRRFKVSRRETFVTEGSTGSLFRSSERQQIIDYILRSKIKDGGAELGESTYLGSQIAQRFPLHMQARLNEIKHTWVTFWLEEAAGVVPRPWSPCSVPLSTTMHRIIHTVKHFFHNLLLQPLDSIAEYYGEGVAFYFAFLSFYTRWLIPPSVLGFIVFIYQVRDLQLDHWLCMPYSILVMVWTCFLLVFWRQRSASLAYRWGVLDFEVQETERPQFKGKRYIDKDTLESRKHYSVWKRVLKYSFTVPVLLGTFIAMLAIMSTVFTTQDRVLLQYKNREPITYWPEITLFDGLKNNGWRRLQEQTHGISDSVNGALGKAQGAFSIHIDTDEFKNPDFWSVTFLYPSLYGIITNVLSALFNDLAIRINDFENHRTQSEYTNHLVLKIIIFRFTAVFLALYYYAFFSTYSTDASYMRMSVTIFSLMTSGQWTGAFIDVAVPALLHRLSLYRLRVAVSGANKLLYKAKEYADERKNVLWRQEHHFGSSNSNAGSDKSSGRSSDSSTKCGIDTYAHVPAHAGNTSDDEKNEGGESEEEELPLADLEAGQHNASTRASSPRPGSDASEPSRLSVLVSSMRMSSLGGGQRESDDYDYWGDSSPRSSAGARKSVASSGNSSHRRPSSYFGSDSTSSSSSGSGFGNSYWGKTLHRFGGSTGSVTKTMSSKERKREAAAVKALDETIERRAKYLDQARSRSWEEALMTQYRPFTDYSTSVVQLGFVVFFSPVFPLAPLIALINNVCLLRLGAFKMCYTRQRPIAAKSGGIGVWEDVLQIMSVIAIVTNCCLLGLTSAQLRSLLPRFSDMAIAVSLFLLEHGLLLFKYWLHAAVPRLPLSVHRAQAKDQLQKDQIQRDRQKRHSQSRRARASSGNSGGRDGGEDHNQDDNHDDDEGEGTPVPAADSTRSHASLNPDDRPIKPMDASKWDAAGFERALDTLDDRGLDTRASLGIHSAEPKRMVRFADDARTGDSPAAQGERLGAYRRSSMCVRSKNAAEGNSSPRPQHKYHRHRKHGKHKDSDSDNGSSTNSDSDNSDSGSDSDRSFAPIDTSVAGRRQSWLEASPYNANTKKDNQKPGSSSTNLATENPRAEMEATPHHEFASGTHAISGGAGAAITGAVKATKESIASKAREYITAMSAAPATSTSEVETRSTLQRAPSWDPSSFFEKLAQVRQAAEPAIRPVARTRTAREMRLEAAAEAKAKTQADVQARLIVDSIVPDSATITTAATVSGKVVPYEQRPQTNEDTHDQYMDNSREESYEASDDEHGTMPVWAANKDKIRSVGAGAGTEDEDRPIRTAAAEEGGEALHAPAVAPTPAPAVPAIIVAAVLRPPNPADERPLSPMSNRKNTFSAEQEQPLTPLLYTHTTRKPSAEVFNATNTVSVESDGDELKTSKTLGTAREAAAEAAAVSPVPSSTADKVQRGMSGRTTVASTLNPPAAVTSTVTSNVANPTPTNKAQSLDDKLRNIDVLNSLVRDAVSFVGAVAANRSAATGAHAPTHTPVAGTGAKGNPFLGLLSTEASLLTHTKDEGAEGPSSPRRGGRVTKPTGGGAAGAASSAPQPTATASATETTAVHAIPSSKVNAGPGSQPSGLTPPRRGQAASAMSAPTSALRGSRAVSSNSNSTTSQEDSDRENTSASTANMPSAIGANSSTTPPPTQGQAKASGLPRTPVRGGATASKMTTSRSQPVIAIGSEPVDKEAKKDEGKPKMRPISSNPFSFAIE